MKAEQGINILWNCLKIISFRRKGFKEILPYILMKKWHYSIMVSVICVIV